MAQILPAAHPMRVSYAMWQLDGHNGIAPRQDLNASTLDEAVKLATPPSMRTALAARGFPSFVILETDETAREGKARHTLHFYTVKCKREWRPDGAFGSPIKVAVPYAIPAGSLAMNEFEPRRPFSAMLDCPATGRQPGEARLIEAGR